jgi:hypothetical protein
MSTNPLILKNPKGWFAAGSEVQKAMTILSDGAFKLFVHICLHARRDTGVMETSQTDLARTLKKAHGTVRSYLREMQSAGVCQTKFSRHPFARGVIQIAEAFWPYQNPEGKTAPQPGSDAFVVQVREMLEARACVRSSFRLRMRSWRGSGLPVVFPLNKPSRRFSWRAPGNTCRGATARHMLRSPVLLTSNRYSMKSRDRRSTRSTGATCGSRCSAWKHYGKRPTPGRVCHRRSPHEGSRAVKRYAGSRQQCRFRFAERAGDQLGQSLTKFPGPKRKEMMPGLNPPFVFLD